MKGDRTIAGLSTIFNQALRYLLFDNQALKEPPKSTRETEVTVSNAEGMLSNEHEPDVEYAMPQIGRQRRTNSPRVRTVNETQDSGSEVNK